jgi:hypothetical protein
MKSFLLCCILFISLSFYEGKSYAAADSSCCYCKDTLSKDCDLLPDLTVSVQAITDSGGYKEYPQTGAGSNFPFQGNDDGRLRVTVATPNIGNGPLKIMGTDTFICGIDTFKAYPGECGDGKIPSRLVLQRIYHKNNDSIRYLDRTAGTMTYHAFHKHIHVDDWVVFSLRIKNPAETDPLKWPIVGQSNKMGYCLLNAANCSQLIGYCRDKNNAVLQNNDIQNFGMDNFKTCGDTVQGISNGYIDVYVMDTEGMWIDIPPGTCNGLYYIVVSVDPLNNFLESDEDNNVVIVPVILSKQDTTVAGTVKIQADKPLLLCKGDKIKLTAPGALSYIWSTGDSTQSIFIDQAGTYSVTAKLSCGTVNPEPITVSIFDSVFAPVIMEDTVCIGGSAILKAGIPGDSIYWFTSANAEKTIHYGPTFKTPLLNSSTIYYVEKRIMYPGPGYAIGKTDTSGAGGYQAGGEFLSFDCISSFILYAVTIYASDSGYNTIRLKDQYGIVLNGKLIHFTKGKNHIVLNIPVAPGKNYQLQLSGTDDTLYSNYGNISYPYTIPGVLSINNSSAGKTAYFFFYDWEVKASDLKCNSVRVPVTAHVDTTCHTSIPYISFFPFKIETVPNPFLENTSITIHPADQGPYTLNVFDLNGRLIREDKTFGTQFFFKKKDLRQGIYFYRICNRNGLSRTGKLIIE